MGAVSKDSGRGWRWCEENVLEWGRSSDGSDGEWIGLVGVVVVVTVVGGSGRW